MKERKVLFGVLGGCGCLGLVAAVGVVVALVLTRQPSGPFSGDASARVVLESDEGGGAVVAPILVARLEALGVEAEAEEVTNQRIVLTLSGVSDATAAIALILPPSRLGLYLVAEDQGPLTGDEALAPPGVIVRSEFGGPPVFEGPDEASLAPILARAAGIPARIAAIECQDDRDDFGPTPVQRCTPYLLEAPAGITNADLANVVVDVNDFSNVPVVSIELSEAGAVRFADLTRRGVRRKLAIVVDGRVVSAPLIQEPITGGRAQISLGSSSSFDEQLGETHALAAGLSTEPLPNRWTVAEISGPIP